VPAEAWSCQAGAVPDEPRPDRDLGAIAGLIGDATRMGILAALAEGESLPAGELARRTGVRPATVAGHLRRLVDGGLVAVRAQGRHRYHELANPQVAALVEALAQLAPAKPVRSLRASRASRALVEARTCYDHLAGRRGVELRDRLIAVGAVVVVDGRDHELTGVGHDLLTGLGVDVPDGRRVFARTCVDWTQRRPHLAGALPAAITARLLQLGWLRRAEGRSLRPAPDYDDRLAGWLGRAG
jgi:DNA-binding transcriptional ArsR family regulator